METTNTIQPMLTNQRIAYLDVLRGIAIFFIFVANIAFFSGYVFDFEGLYPEASKLVIDPYLEFIAYAFIDGKFYSIFSMLFGIGFAIQQNKLINDDPAFVSFFRKRMTWLLIIGLFHLVFVWLGDILVLYALTGFVLVAFRNTANKNLIRLAIVLLLTPIFHSLFIYMVYFYPMHVFQLNTAFWEMMGLPLKMTDFGPQADIQYYLTTQSFKDFFLITVSNPLIRYGRILQEGRFFKVLAMFLVGLWAGRHIIHHQLLENRSLLKKIMIWGFVIGLPFSILRTYIHFELEMDSMWGMVYDISYAFGTAPLAVAYAASLVLLFHVTTGFNRLMAPVGRMALTNYLMHSLLCIPFFYGFGLNMIGELTYTYILLLALGIFTFQVFFSRWWLSRYKQGPMEWLWRKAVYFSSV